jgi:hypothetical protein
MKGYIEKLSKIDGATSKITSAWKAGNRALMCSMGEDYFFLDDNQLGTAMLINDDAFDTIKSELRRGFNNVDEHVIAPLAKSVATGTYFTVLGKQPPKSTPMPTVEKPEGPIVEINAAEKEQMIKDAEKLAKAKRAGRGNPVFQKLMPGSLDGKFIGKTGKFTVEYPTGANVAQTLNAKVGDIADFADEQLGNDEYMDNKQRVFVSKELQKGNTSICVVMYHGIAGDQNKEIAAAVKNAVRDAIPYSTPLILGTNTSVLNTELHLAKINYPSCKFDIPKQPNKNIISSVRLDEKFAPRQPAYEQEACLAI